MPLTGLSTQQSTTDAFLAIDASGTCVYLDPNCAALFGAPQEALVGQNVWTEFPDCFGAACREAYGAVMRTRQPTQVYDFFPPRNRWLLHRIYPTGDGVSAFLRERFPGKTLPSEPEVGLTGILESTPEITWLVSQPDGQVLYVSPTYTELLGATGEALIGGSHALTDSVHPDDRELVRTMLAQARWGEVSEIQYRVARPDGTMRWVSTRAMPLRADGTDSWQVAGVTEDVTERKLAAEQLRRSDAILDAMSGVAERLLRTERWQDGLLEVLARIGQSTDVDRVYLFENSTGAGGELLASRRAGWVRPGQDAREGPDELCYDALGLQRWREVLSRGETLQCHVRDAPEGERRLLAPLGVRSFVIVPIQLREEWWGFIGFACCAEERGWSPAEVDAVRVAASALGSALQRESFVRALQRSESWFRALTQHSQDGISVVDVDGALRFCTPAVFRLLGYRERSLLGVSIFDVLHPDDVPGVRRALERLCEPGHPPVSVEARVRTRRGGWQVHEAICSNLLDDPVVQGIVVNSRDVSYRRSAEDALRESERRYRHFFEESLTGDYVADAAGTILDCNPAFARILGFSAPTELLGVNLSTFYADERVHSMVRALLQGREKIENFEMKLLRPDGTARYVIKNVVGLHDASGELLQLRGYVFDITEFRHTAEQLRMAQKMEAVGRLAGGVAHDFNNLLTVITGFVQLVEQKLDPYSESADHLREIQNAADRATELTQQLLAYGRRQTLQPKILSLNAVVAGAERLLQPLIPEQIRIRTVLDPLTRRVKADPGQLEQVIVNLVLNARDAIPDGGEILMRTCNREVHDSECRKHRFLLPGSYASLLVQDTGTGIEPEVLAHIFEPFFTTKAYGKGTGLGLSTAYGIIKQSGGFILVGTEPGKGSTFEILLPQVGAPAHTTTAGEVAGFYQPAETILLVEDEEALRLLARKVLERSGYQVLEAASGEDALRVLNDAGTPVDLLLTDVIMPRMGGQTLARRLRAADPHIKVVFMSGHAGDTLDEQGVLDRRTTLLKKPFRTEQLVQVVREALAADSG